MSREDVLAAVRRALGGTLSEDMPDSSLPEEGSPQRPGLGGDLMVRFRRELEAVAGFVREGGEDQLEVVREFVEEEGLVGVYAPGFADLDGIKRVDEEIARGEPDRVLGLARADWGVAASGSLVIDSGPFLPVVLVETSLVVLRSKDLVATLADLPPPQARRLVVTGPARTADIEKKIVLGAHGPRRLGALVVS